MCLLISISVALHLHFWRPVRGVQMKWWKIDFQTLIYSFCSHSALLRWVWGWADLPTSIIVFKALRITYSACVPGMRVRACVCAFGERVKEHWSGKESEQMSARIVVQLKLHTSQAERWAGGHTGCSYWHGPGCSFTEVTSHTHTSHVCVNVGYCKWFVSSCYNELVSTKI